jgi:hypothetical protein
MLGFVVVGEPVAVPAAGAAVLGAAAAEGAAGEAEPKVLLEITRAAMRETWTGILQRPGPYIG